MTIEFRTRTIDGKLVSFTSETIFVVEVGRYRGAYRTRYSFKGDLAKAGLHYRAVKIGNGYKKRLRMLGANKEIIARYIS
jgi:hypothetical protein